MNNTRHLTLQAGERVFLNGAVVKFDRKVSIEILNTVEYLREHQVMQVEETATPLRQLYFVLQTMMIDPASRAGARKMYDNSYAWLMRTFSNMHVRSGLEEVNGHVEGGNLLEGLRTLRTLFSTEDQILGRATVQDQFLEAV